MFGGQVLGLEWNRGKKVLFGYTHSVHPPTFCAPNFQTQEKFSLGGGGYSVLQNRGYSAGSCITDSLSHTAYVETNNKKRVAATLQATVNGLKTYPSDRKMGNTSGGCVGTHSLPLLLITLVKQGKSICKV